MRFENTMSTDSTRCRSNKSTKKLLVGLLWLSACCTLSSVQSFAEGLGTKHTIAESPQQNQADDWYSPARLGVFYHWGLATGGKGNTCKSSKLPVKYKSAKEFEQAAPSPEVFARNLVELTQRVGGRYLILTLAHSCNGHMMIFPTTNEMYINKTKGDYLGEVLKQAHARDIKVVAYLPGGPHHWSTQGQVWLANIQGDPKKNAQWASLENLTYYLKQMRLLLEEINLRHSKVGSLDGVWIDGAKSFQKAPFNGFEMLRDVYPNGVLVGNNQHQFTVPEMNIAAAEFLVDEAIIPPYNRPAGATRPFENWGAGVQLRNDYIEDIPVISGWWSNGTSRIKEEYAKDPTFWVKQMVSSLGQRRKWNFTTGMAINIDGTIVEQMQPTIGKMAAFLSWASPAIYNTVGGLGSQIYPGWFNGGGFASVTRSFANPNEYYLLVTQPPTAKKSGDMIIVQTEDIKLNGIKSVSDLRTGKSHDFEQTGVLQINDIKDWSDIDNYGAKVFKIVLSD